MFFASIPCFFTFLLSGFPELNPDEVDDHYTITLVELGRTSPFPHPELRHIRNRNRVYPTRNDYIKELGQLGPEEHRDYLGSRLYDRVAAWEFEHTAKVTGMILELEQSEIIDLLLSPMALRDRVNEAMDILRKYWEDKNNSTSNDDAASPSNNPASSDR